MLNTPIAWTPLPWTLCHQTPLCPDDNVIHLTNTVRNPTLAITWLSYSINSSDFGTDSLPPCNLPATIPHMWRSFHNLQKTATPYCGAPSLIQIPSLRKNSCTQLCRQISLTLLHDIPMFDGPDSLELEGWFMDMETTTDILTRYCTHLAEAITCGLTCTLIHGALQAGKPWDTRLSNNNNLPDKAASTVPLQCPSTY